MDIKSRIAVGTILPALASFGAAAGQGLTLRYDKPGREWSAEGLPLDNGRLGWAR